MIYDGTTIAIPDGYSPLPLYPEDGDVPLNICLICRSTPALGSPFLLLGETTDASIYLGCLTDRRGDPKSWLEIWVQNVDFIAESFRAQIEAVSNSLIDRRWSERLATFQKLDRSAIIETGWETVHPPPVFMDANAARLIRPVEPATNRPLTLCSDDAALVSAALPAYSSSLHRYLWNGPGIETPVFVATTNSAPTPTGVKTASELFPSLFPFNTNGGFLLVQSFCPLKLVDFGHLYSQLGDADTFVQRGAHLFTGRDGGAGQLREVFHLKVNLILQCLSQTRDAVRCLQLPILNL